MESIEVEYAKVVKRQKLSSDSIKSSIDKLIFSIESAQQSLTAITTATAEAAAAAAAAATVSSINNPPPPPSLSVDQITVQLASKVKDLSSQVSDAQKEFYNTLGKFCKWLDKQKYFKTDLNDIWDPQAFIGKEELIYDTLATHFIREGRFSCCEVFLREAGILQQQQSSTSSSSSSHNHREELREKFKEMYRILEALKNKDLTPAITWARSNRAELQARGSSLEFEMHRAHFISLMTTTTGGGKSSDLALKYAKENLGDFSKQFSKGK